PRALALPRVKRADATRGQLEVAPDRGRLRAIGRGEIVGRNAQRPGPERDTVVATREGEQRPVAVAPHGPDDAQHRALDPRSGLRTPRPEAFQTPPCRRSAGGDDQLARCDHPSSLTRAISAPREASLASRRS